MGCYLTFFTGYECALQCRRTGKDYFDAS
jgi:hypothetical protein